MATPEIVLGASLLTLFVGTANEPWKTLTGGALFPLGIQTILIAHIMFNISFVVVTVRARMQGFPRHLEEAAMDLGATPWATFWKVTFPLILPGHHGRRPARLLALDRRLHRHQLHLGHGHDVPDLGLGQHQEQPAAAGPRHRHDGLRRRRGPRRARARSGSAGASGATGRSPPRRRPRPPPRCATESELDRGGPR